MLSKETLQFLDDLKANNNSDCFLENKKRYESFKYVYQKLVADLLDVMKTGFYLNNFVNRVLIKKNYAKQKFNPNLSSEIVVSDREKEVLSLVCMEFTAQEIASQMDISPRTVEAIKDRLMERFGVKNSVGLVFFAMKNSLID